MKYLNSIPLIILFAFFSCAINKNEFKIIRGVVIDKNFHLPLPGVGISVKDSNSYIQVKENGEFELKVKKGEILYFSLAGMKNKEIKITHKNYYKIVLEDYHKRLKTSEYRREIRKKGQYSWPDNW